MLGDLTAILEFVTGLLDKRKVGRVEKNRDRVIVAVYKIGQDGTSGVTPEELQDAGFTKLQVFDAIEAATEKNWIIDCSTYDGLQWMLNPKAVFYVEALLEERKGDK